MLGNGLGEKVGDGGVLFSVLCQDLLALRKDLVEQARFRGV